jgi:hypothetical protein
MRLSTDTGHVMSFVILPKAASGGEEKVETRKRLGLGFDSIAANHRRVRAPRESGDVKSRAGGRK